ncbi:hypothetical protein [Methylomonas rivi]|uniref:PEP-CTERM sorting domain-containing protein n=1 Tax=Methylomonas rivi TaxID=2952226 RepID=A0ABT1U6F7_9GAMM|nr:hypothetical protein [Methylomonas sp. WSC-6]MBS4052394.1 hypothetical protein [Methylomonas sp.]MCQ8128960.1 hypothetical protein [Methylomonas sp. WSC-6]
MKKVIAIAIFTFLFFSNASRAGLATTGSVYLNAEPGSWVGGGIGASEVLWTHGVEGIFSISKNFDKGVTVNFDDGKLWSFNFAAPTYDAATNTNNGNELTVGFYDQATRFPFNSPTKPGLDFSGNGRGNNTLGGWFDVLEIVYGQNNDILRFAVDFRQFDEREDMSGPSTYGSLRINSDIPVNPVPIPGAVILFVSGLMMLTGAPGMKRNLTIQSA